MINVGRTKYRAFKVQHLVSSKGRPYTRFTIGDSKNVNGQWVKNGYYTFTVFEDLPAFNDGMEYVITSITGVEKTTYNGNDYYNLVGTIDCSVGQTPLEKVAGGSEYYNTNTQNDNVSYGVGATPQQNQQESTFKVFDDDIQF